MAYYQCFKTTARDVYCSSYKVKNHVEGAAWIKEALANFGLQGNDIHGKPFEEDSIPDGATEYP